MTLTCDQQLEFQCEHHQKIVSAGPRFKENLNTCYTLLEYMLRHLSKDVETTIYVRKFLTQPTTVDAFRPSGIGENEGFLPGINKI